MKRALVGLAMMLSGCAHYWPTPCLMEATTKPNGEFARRGEQDLVSIISEYFDFSKFKLAIWFDGKFYHLQEKAGEENYSVCSIDMEEICKDYIGAGVSLENKLDKHASISPIVAPTSCINGILLPLSSDYSDKCSAILSKVSEAYTKEKNGEKCRTYVAQFKK